ncbi:MAG: protein kinase [Polyangiales bacterium]
MAKDDTPDVGGARVLVPLPFEDRYTRGPLLGRGGMGEVHLCHDHTVGREVAMKVIRPRSDESGLILQRRFVREARVQGQLEHPAIVPVYDVGLDPEGALYFTMKRVRGSSLSDVLAGLRAGDESMRHRFNLRRLLSNFAQVCMAVHFAHRKGVVHRDLKPANVMFGDFGEVYVLDWGLASLRNDPPTPHEERVDDGHGQKSLSTGVAGTPGYMAPEQVEPPYAVDHRADIYALGAMLFEILTLEPMHEAGRPAEVVASTLAIDGASPDERTPERTIPPELDRICRAATRSTPADRLASAESLAEAIESYLDGDRDLALRRELSRAHAERADAALAESQREGSDEPAERRRAMREVTAALALDPAHEPARMTLVRLVTEPPRVVPAEAEAEMQRNQREAYEFAGRSGLLFYLGYLLYLPLLLWMGVRDLRLFAFGWGTIAACAMTTWVLLRHPPPRVDVPLVHLAISTFTVGAVSVMYGPFVLVPMLALGNAVAYMSAVGHGRGLVPLAAVLAVVVPTLLRWTGVIPDNYEFEGGRWTILPTVFHIGRVPTQAFLLAAIVGTILPASMFVGRLRRAFMDAERKLQLQAWQLRQIVPEPHAESEARGAADDAPKGPPTPASSGEATTSPPASTSAHTRSMRRP